MKSFLLSFTCLALVCQCALAQSKSRLIAIGANSNGLYKYDSVRFVYSNGRGYDSVADWNGQGYVQYDSSVIFLVHGGVPSPDTNWIVYVNQYDNKNRKTTSRQYMAYNTGWDPAKLYPVYGDSVTYNTAGHVDRVFGLDNSITGSWGVRDECVFTYDPNGLLLSREVTDNSQQQHHAKFGFVYNTTGQLVEESHTMWQNGAWWEMSKTAYTWSGSSLVSEVHYVKQGSQWEPQSKIEYHSPHTAMKLATYSNYRAGTWEITKVDSNLYDIGGDNYVTYYRIAGAAPGQWRPLHRILKTYDNQHKLVTALTQYYDSAAAGFTDRSRTLYTYDAGGLLIVERHENWNIDSAKWLPQEPGWYETRYHYLEGNPAGVGEYHANLEAEIYPNPAVDILHLQIEGHADKKVQLSIAGMDGRVHRAWTVTVVQPELHIPLHDLPAGNYVLQLLTAEGGAQAMPFVVVR